MTVNFELNVIISFATVVSTTLWNGPLLFLLLSELGQILPKQAVEASYLLPERKEEKGSLQGQDNYILLEMTLL
jgi:hypothetical protein